VKKTIFAALCLLALPLFQVYGRRPARAPKPRVIHLNTDNIRLEMTQSREEIVDVNNFSTLSKYLQTFQRTVSPNDQDQIVSEMNSFCVDRGLRPSPDTAELFMSLSRQARQKGSWTTYRKYARYATSFAPWAPSPHLALAEVARRKEGFFSGNFFFESLMAFIGSFVDLDTKPTTMVNLALWLRTTMFLVLGLLSLLLLFKYQTLLRHDVTEWLGGGSSSWIDMAGLIVLFLPSLLLLSGYWWVIYWAGLFLHYAKWPERVVVIITIMLFVATGAFSYYTYQTLYLTRTSPHDSNIRNRTNRIDMSLDGALTDHIAPDDPLDKTFATLLGGRYMLHGSYAKAQNIYHSLLKEYPDDARGTNNLGCVYFYENRYEEAIQQFSRAVTNDPSMAVAYFNRSIAKNKVFDFTGSQEDQRTARKLNPKLLEQPDFNQTEDWLPIPVWLSLSTTRSTAARLAESKPLSMEGAIKPGNSVYALIFKPAFSTWAMLFLFGFIALLAVKKPSFFARACNKCGQPFCSRCKTSLEFESYCSQCVHLFIKQDGVSPEARLKKNYEVRHYRLTSNIAGIIFGLLAPGSAHILEGRAATGIIILFLWCGLIAGFIAPFFFLPYPFAVVTSIAPISAAYLLVGGGLALVLWVAFGLVAALKNPASVQSHGMRS